MFSIISIKKPWGYNDPVEYIATAHSLNAGQGLGYVQGHGRFSPIRIHPPFYSLVLAAIGLFKANLIVASRWLNILAFVACIFIAGWIFYRYSRAPALGIITSALMLAFPQMLWMFSSAYSEPLFILLILSGGLSLVACLQRERPSLLVLSAVLIGLIPLTRYAGVAMLAAGTLSVLLLSSGRAWARFKKALLFGLLASLPVLVWLVWTWFSSAHTLGGRSLTLAGQALGAQFQTFRGLFIDTVGRWVPFQNNKFGLAYRWRFLLAGLGLTGILALSAWAILRLRKNLRSEDGRFDLPIFSYFGLSAFFFVAVLLAHLPVQPPHHRYRQPHAPALFRLLCHDPLRSLRPLGNGLVPRKHPGPVEDRLIEGLEVRSLAAPALQWLEDRLSGPGLVGGSRLPGLVRSTGARHGRLLS